MTLAIIDPTLKTRFVPIDRTTCEPSLKSGTDTYLSTCKLIQLEHFGTYVNSDLFSVEYLIVYNIFTKAYSAATILSEQLNGLQKQ